MTKYESKLLSKWSRHHSRGMAIFILVRGILFFAVPFAGTFWICHVFIFNHHTFHWDEVVYSCGIGLVFGIIKAVSTWRKMERFYADSQKQQEVVA